MNEEEKKAISNLNKLLNDFANNDISEIDLFVINRLIQKQSKMINIMAENLTTPTHDKAWVIEYFENEVKLE